MKKRRDYWPFPVDVRVTCPRLVGFRVELSVELVTFPFSIVSTKRTKIILAVLHALLRHITTRLFVCLVHVVLHRPAEARLELALFVRYSAELVADLKESEEK